MNVKLVFEYLVLCFCFGFVCGSQSETYSFKVDRSSGRPVVVASKPINESNPLSPDPDIVSKPKRVSHNPYTPLIVRLNGRPIYLGIVQPLPKIKKR